MPLRNPNLRSHIISFVHWPSFLGWTDAAKAVEKGYLDLITHPWSRLRWIDEDDTVARHARHNDHLDVIKYLHARGGGHAMDYAAESGHIEVVKWLHVNRKEGCSTDAMDWAAKNGHLEVVKFLHSNRKEGCTKWAMDNAAKNDHLEVV